MKKKASNLNTLTNSLGYKINSPNCGRDKNGVFHCKCGKCEPLFPKTSNDRSDSSNNSSSNS